MPPLTLLSDWVIWDLGGVRHSDMSQLWNASTSLQQVWREADGTSGKEHVSEGEAASEATERESEQSGQWTLSRHPAPLTGVKKISVSAATCSFSSSPTASCGPFPCDPIVVPAGKKLGPAASGRREFMSWLIVYLPSSLLGFTSLLLCQPAINWKHWNRLSLLEMNTGVLRKLLLWNTANC